MATGEDPHRGGSVGVHGRGATEDNTSERLHIPRIDAGHDLVRGALAWAAAGWYIGPAKLGKNPGSILGKGWPGKTTRDPGEIVDLFAGAGGNTVVFAHVGRSGGVAFDLDRPELTPEPLRRAILDQHPPFQTTRDLGDIDEAEAVRRFEQFELRAHVLFRMPPGRIIGNGLGGLGRGWGEVRGLNGVVVVAPSGHANPAGRYALHRPGPVPVMPECLANLLPSGRAGSPQATSAEVHQALSDWVGTSRRTALRPVLRKWDSQVRGRGASRHETLRDLACWASREARRGWYPLQDAMSELWQRWDVDMAIELGSGRTEPPDQRRAEFDGVFAWAIAQAASDTEDGARGAEARMTGRGATVRAPSMLPAGTVTELPAGTVDDLSEGAVDAPPDIDAEVLAVAEIVDDNSRRAASRALVRKAACAEDVDEEQLQGLRDKLHGLGLAKGDFAALVRAARDEAAKAERERVEAERTQRLRQAVDDAEREGRRLPSPGAPHAVAEALARLLPKADGVPAWAYWRGDWYRWDGAHWAAQDPSVMRNWTYGQTKDAVYVDEATSDIRQWNPRKTSVDQVLDAMASEVLYRRYDLDDDKVIAFRNGALDLSAGRLLQHTPARFNLMSLPFDYDPGAGCPQWEAFLRQVLGGDAEVIQLLQEWFGYVVSGRTDLQKGLLLHGQRRSGKGTVGRIMVALLGQRNVAAKALGQLGTHFGQQCLIGKTLNFSGDTRWEERGLSEAVPVLLGIIGEDYVSVPRKNLSDWTGKLPTRFMISSNDAPKLKDASQALVGRLLTVSFTETFYGREDHGLEARLMTELPGIMNWGLVGLRQLASRGRFAEPASSREMADEVARSASPVTAFVDDLCELDPAASVNLDVLFKTFQGWCRAEGRDYPGTKSSFSQALVSAYGRKFATRRVGRGSSRYQSVQGLRLSPAAAASVATPLTVVS